MFNRLTYNTLINVDMQVRMFFELKKIRFSPSSLRLAQYIIKFIFYNLQFKLLSTLCVSTINSLKLGIFNNLCFMISNYDLFVM